MSLEAAITKYLSKRGLVSDGLRVSQELASALVELSDMFTSGRAELPSDYFDLLLHRDAYLAGFTLTNAAKISWLLEQHNHLFPKNGELSVLDIGSGPGTCIFAASEYLSRHRPGQKVRFVGLEKNRSMVEAAAVLAKDILPKEHSVEWVISDASKVNRIIKNAEFNVSIAANVFNEIESASEVLLLCKKILRSSGALFVVDPALKNTTRALMELRDSIVDAGGAVVFAPCTHQKNCPMLKANKRDWCHFYVEWSRLSLIEEIDRATRLDHRYLKMGYMVFVRMDGSLRKNNDRPWRVVSAPLKTKGKTEIVVCGNGGLKKLRRLDRDRTEENAFFDTIKRGDLIDPARF